MKKQHKPTPLQVKAKLDAKRKEVGIQASKAMTAMEKAIIKQDAEIARRCGCV
jgi:hypothetical protein